METFKEGVSFHQERLFKCLSYLIRVPYVFRLQDMIELAEEDVRECVQYLTALLFALPLRVCNLFRFVRIVLTLKSVFFFNENWHLNNPSRVIIIDCASRASPLSMAAWRVILRRPHSRGACVCISRAPVHESQEKRSGNGLSSARTCNSYFDVAFLS